METVQYKANPPNRSFGSNLASVTAMSAPPAGPPAQLEDQGTSYQTNIIVCAVITWLIAVAFVAMRFYTRRVLLRVLRWEDWMIVVALVFAAANNAGMIERMSKSSVLSSMPLSSNWFLRSCLRLGKTYMGYSTREHITFVEGKWPRNTH